MFERIAEYTSALLGRSAYQAAPPYATTQSIDSDQVERIRRSMGGQIQLPTVPQTRWYLAQLEAAEYDADAGLIELAAKLMRAARMDGVFSGVLSTRTGGLVRLPKRFRGDPDVVAALEIGHESSQIRSVFDEMFPPSELSQLAADGVLLGVGVGELVPVEGRDYPVFVRLEPQFLVYRWIENRWYYRSAAGLLPIEPGNGRWILHTPGGRMSPWVNGIWRAIGRAYIRKEHAALHKDNWEGKLANPARVAVAPAGGTDEQADHWFRAVMAWGVNTVFGMRPGYDVKLIESNGRGWDSFNKTIADQNNEMIIAVAGQVVTTDGGAGFSNSDVHRTIRADLIKQTADDLAYSLNTQGIPAFVASRWGEDAIEDKPCVVEWDVTPPKDRTAEATALVTVANAIKLLREALGEQVAQLDVAAMCTRFGVPVIDNAAVAPVTTKRAPLRLVEDIEDDELEDADDELEDDDKIADTAFNGAQVASLVEIVQAVADGTLPRDSAIEIVKVAFNVDDAQAARILGSAGNDFVSSGPGDEDDDEDDDEDAEVAA